jgi:hypothetical protein
MSEGAGGVKGQAPKVEFQAVGRLSLSGRGEAGYRWASLYNKLQGLASYR